MATLFNLFLKWPRKESKLIRLVFEHRGPGVGGIWVWEGCRQAACEVSLGYKVSSGWTTI